MTWTTLAALDVARNPQGHLRVTVIVDELRMARHDFRTLGGALHWAWSVITTVIRAEPETLKGPPS